MLMKPGARRRPVTSISCFAGFFGEVADGGDAIAADRDVGHDGRLAGSVVDRAAAEDHVVVGTERGSGQEGEEDES